jgi:folate-dependent phosphoribosylglycinamide formyltransferase PurN
MKALVLTSNSLRHRYFAQSVARSFDVPVALVEAKKNYYAFQQQKSIVIRTHFDDIRATERTWFADAESPASPKIQLIENINTMELIDWALKEKFDVLCLFGTSILGSDWLDAFPSRIVNLHLGLSPYYRGSGTLFWPFVNRELQFLGTTIHLAVAKIDAGAVLAQIYPDLHLGDNYYVITNRLIRKSIDQFPALVADYLSERLSPKIQEATDSKAYRKSDFSEDALIAALGYVGDGLSAGELKRIESARVCRY